MDMRVRLETKTGTKLISIVSVLTRELVTATLVYVIAFLDMKVQGAVGLFAQIVAVAMVCADL
jgi:hypothetical protein